MKQYRHPKIIGMIDDQPITQMPKFCTIWNCDGNVRPNKGFMCCDKCGGSYGPVDNQQQERKAG